MGFGCGNYFQIKLKMNYCKNREEAVLCFAQIRSTFLTFYPYLLLHIMHSKVQFITIQADSAGQRIDNFLMKVLKGAPKSLIYRIIRKGEVRVNKGRVKPERKLKLDDVVRVPPIKLADSKEPAVAGDGLIEHVKQSIIYENDQFLVVNKSSGLAVHGGSGIQIGLIEVLRQIAGEGQLRELVHRLDRETSGCILVAKDRDILRHFHELFRVDHKVDKTYHALAMGHWPEGCQKVNAPLKKNELQSGERMVKVDLEGRESETHFKVLCRYKTATLIEAKPITGRTHQIRVHALHAKHPLVGDAKYGFDDVNKQFKGLGFKRLFLHAFSLKLALPDGSEFYIEAPLPDDLGVALSALV